MTEITNDPRADSPEASTQSAVVVRVMHWMLFSAAFLVWPLPLFGLDGSTIPAARFLQLAISLSALIATEGSGGLVGVFALVLWAHAVIYGLFGVALSAFVVRVLALRLPRRMLVGCVAGAVVVILTWGVFGARYDTLFHHSNAHARLMSLYQ